MLAAPIKLLTLNIAHGRRDGLNQALLRDETIRRNILDVAAVMKRVGADIVALQEADRPSRWSGNFDHVATLAQTAGYPWYALGEHADSWLFTYGAGLLSRTPFAEVLSHPFRPTPPTMTKGFLLGQIKVRPERGALPAMTIDVISVHLDFSRQAVRQRQIDEMVAVLAGRNDPVIILGDFNSEWLAGDSAVERIVRLRRLHAFRPSAEDLGTYRSNSRRYDWILASRELEFRSYTVLPDILSDHSAVVAEVSTSANDPVD